MALAKTTFGGRTTDQLIAQDVYGVFDSLPRNQATELISELGGVVLETVSSIVGNSGSIEAALAKMDAGDIVDQATQASQRLTQALGGGSLSGLASTTKTQLAQSFGGIAELGGTVKAVVGDSQTLLKGNVSTTQSIARLTNALTQSEMAKVFDMQAEYAMLDTLVKGAMETGLSDAIDLVAQDASRTEVLEYVLAGNVGTAAKAGNVSGLEKIVEAVGGERVIGSDPGVSSTLLSNYSNPGLTQDQYATATGQLTGVLAAIDSQWNLDTRNGQSELNLGAYGTLSSDAKTLLSQSEEHMEAALLSELYPEVSLSSLIRSQYPSAGIV